jgi:Tfp pilus assembly protein PilP
MMTRPRHFVAAAAVLTVLGLVASNHTVISGQEPVKKIPTAPRESKVAIEPLMHAKLAQSQRVFEGLVTRDFDRIRRSAEELSTTTLTLPGVAPGEHRDDEVFEHFRLEFLRLAGRLGQLAEARNLEGSAYVSEQLNSTCIACHEYLRDELKVKPSNAF